MLIAGAKGFAKEILEVLISDFPGSELNFFDDITARETLFCGKYLIIKSFDDVEALFRRDNEFILGVGSTEARRFFYEKFTSLGGMPRTIVSRQAIVGQHDNAIGKGTVIMPLALIESSNRIGNGVLVHAGAFISHDTVIGDYSEISPYVKILGNASIGKGCTIGTAAIILPGISVGDHAIVGAGAVVVKDVSAGSKVAGVPAKALL